MTFRVAVIRAVMIAALLSSWARGTFAQETPGSALLDQVEPEIQAPQRVSPFYPDEPVKPSPTARRQVSREVPTAPNPTPARAKTPLPATAEFDEEAGAEATRSPSSLGPSLFWVTGILAVGWIARQCLKTGGPFQSRANSSLEVLSRQTLGPQQQLALIRLGSKVLLVGTTPSGMSTLTTIESPAEVEQLLRELRPAPSTPRPTWRDYFNPPAEAPETRQPIDSLSLSTSRTDTTAEQRSVRSPRSQNVEVTDV